MLAMIEAKTAEDFEAMRIVRNECASWMTGDTKPISQQDQAVWVATFDKTLVQPFVFERVLSVGSEGAIRGVVGYGLVRRRSRYADPGKGIMGTWWISGGLLPNWRGQGLGKALFGMLAERVTKMGEICWLDVRTDNQPAIRTYKSLGFHALEGTLKKGDVDVIEMFRNPPSKMPPERLVT